MADDEKKKKCPTGAPAWMTTFADLMSLLMCFFVLLLSFSVMDSTKYKVVSGSMRDAFGFQKKVKKESAPLGEEMISRDFETVPFDPRREIETIVEDLQEAGLVEHFEDGKRVNLRVREQLAFDSGKAEVKNEFASLLDRLGPVFVRSEADVEVHGHSDNVLLGKDSPYNSNWALSAARAVAVTEYLQEKFAIPSQRLSAAGFSDGSPVGSNFTEEGRAKNRRVEFWIDPKRESSTLEDIFSGGQ